MSKLLVLANEATAAQRRVLSQDNTVGELGRNQIEKSLGFCLWKAKHVFQSTQKCVLAAGRHMQIANRIVQFVSIFVMNNLVRCQLPSYRVFDDHSMLPLGSSPLFAAPEHQIATGNRSLSVGATETLRRITMLFIPREVHSAVPVTVRAAITPINGALRSIRKRSVALAPVVAHCAKSMLFKFHWAFAAVGRAWPIENCDTMTLVMIPAKSSRVTSTLAPAIAALPLLRHTCPPFMAS